MCQENVIFSTVVAYSDKWVMSKFRFTTTLRSFLCRRRTSGFTFPKWYNIWELKIVLQIYFCQKIIFSSPVHGNWTSEDCGYELCVQYTDCVVVFLQNCQQNLVKVFTIIVERYLRVRIVSSYCRVSISLFVKLSFFDKYQCCSAVKWLQFNWQFIQTFIFSFLREVIVITLCDCLPFLVQTLLRRMPELETGISRDIAAA